MNLNANNRIVVTGGTGFIGANLVSRLVNDGYLNVLNISRTYLNAQVESVKGDFGDVSFLGSVIREGDVVVHLACTTIPATSELDPEKDFQENVIGTANLLEVCRLNKAKKIIFISSGGTVYGDQGEQPIKEESEAKPVGAHGAMKLAIENQLMIHQREYGLDYLIVRVANPYGRLSLIDKPQGAVDIFLRHAIHDEPINIWGDGRVVRDYIFIDDLVELLLMAIRSDIVNETFNAGSGRGFSLNQLLEIIENLSGKKPVVNYLEKRGFDLPYNVLDISKAQALFGWSPKWPLEEGIIYLLNKLK